MLRMAEGDTLDGFAGKPGGMAARFAGLGSTLDDAAMVKKLLDSVQIACTRRWPESNNFATCPPCRLRTRSVA
jgi:hypothetical protein